MSATKQQEREALEKIEKIIEALGPDSYIATSFEGCFEDAERNIEDDAAYSMKSRLESAENKIRQGEAERQSMRNSLERECRIVEGLRRELFNAQETCEQKDAEIAKLKSRINELLEDTQKGADYIFEQNNRICELQRRAEDAEAEVIRLKAKLYDLLIAEKGEK